MGDMKARAVVEMMLGDRPFALWTSTHPVTLDQEAFFVVRDSGMPQSERRLLAG
jgi:hypothetical protein